MKNMKFSKCVLAMAAGSSMLAAGSSRAAEFLTQGLDVAWTNCLRSTAPWLDPGRFGGGSELEPGNNLELGSRSHPAAQNQAPEIGIFVEHEAKFTLL
jgi:hypothetical protein